MKAQIGDEAAIRFYSGNYGFGYKVTKVTPTGRITIVRNSDNYEMKFKANGDREGSTKYREDVILLGDHITIARGYVAEKNRKHTAIKLLQEIEVRGRMYDSWDKESFQRTIEELQAKLDAAKAAVNAI